MRKEYQRERERRRGSLDSTTQNGCNIRTINGLGTNTVVVEKRSTKESREERLLEETRAVSGSQKLCAGVSQHQLRVREVVANTYFVPGVISFSET